MRSTAKADGASTSSKRSTLLAEKLLKLTQVRQLLHSHLF
jgi:hypothetical protein